MTLSQQKYKQKPKISNNAQKLKTLKFYSTPNVEIKYIQH